MIKLNQNTFTTTFANNIQRSFCKTTFNMTIGNKMHQTPLNITKMEQKEQIRTNNVGDFLLKVVLLEAKIQNFSVSKEEPEPLFLKNWNRNRAITACLGFMHFKAYVQTT